MAPTFPQTVIKSLIADALGKYLSSFTHPALVDAAEISDGWSRASKSRKIFPQEASRQASRATTHTHTCGPLAASSDPHTLTRDDPVEMIQHSLMAPEKVNSPD